MNLYTSSRGQVLCSTCLTYN